MLYSAILKIEKKKVASIFIPLKLGYIFYSKCIFVARPSNNITRGYTAICTGINTSTGCTCTGEIVRFHYHFFLLSHLSHDAHDVFSCNDIRPILKHHHQHFMFTFLCFPSLIGVLENSSYYYISVFA